MTTHDEVTSIDRPLTRGDINDVRLIVQQTSDRLLEFIASVKALDKRMDGYDARLKRFERKAWLPALVSVVAAAFSILARMVP